MRYLFKLFLIFQIIFICLVSEDIIGQERTVYKIQVASFPKEYSLQRIKADLGISEDISMHRISGRYKYFVGEFDSRAAATAHLPNVPVNGAWVVPVKVPGEVAVAQQEEVPVQKVDQAKIAETPIEKPTAEQETVSEMVFRIQVAADRRFVDPEKIRRERGLEEYAVDYYFKNGWYKYNMGDFKTREIAEKFMTANDIAGWVVEAPIDRIVGGAVIEGQETDRAIVVDITERDSTGELLVQDSTKNIEGVRRVQQRYNSLIAVADSAFTRGDYITAKTNYELAIIVDPSKDYPRQRLGQIPEGAGDEKSTQRSRRIKVLIYGVITLLVIMIAVLAFTLILRSQRKKRQKKDDVLKDEIQDSLTEYLFDEDATQPEMVQGIRGSKDKQVLIDELMQLYANLSGEISNKLRELYIDLGLDNESVKKTQSHQWHIRAKGFRELAQMNIKTVNEEIEKCLNSDNDVLRMEAQLAMIRLNYEDPFSFLNKLEKVFTSWEQLHVYEMITRHQVNLPDFTQWLSSRNESIVIFCIRMIRAFKQSEEYKKLFPFLKHANKDIREETIITLGELRILDTLPELKERFVAEDQEAKVLILQALTKMPEDQNIDFLQEILEPSNALRLQAAEALSRIESFGVKGIETILRRSDDDLQAVARHILDSKTR